MWESKKVSIEELYWDWYHFKVTGIIYFFQQYLALVKANNRITRTVW